MEIYERLLKLQSEGKSIRTGLVGCGQMGSGLVHVTNQMAGMDIMAIADINIDRPLKVFTGIGIPKNQVCATNKLSEAADAIRSGKRLITEDALLLAQIEELDVVVEATGLSETGAQVAWGCIEHAKHIVMLNVETDVTIGPLLYRQSKRSGCVYTAASGDEPGVCKMLYNFAGMLGFEIVCLGKGKNNVIDFEATPDSCRADAEAKGMNPKMLSAFRDGSKTMVELAAMSNATGLVPDIPGMHGPRADIHELNKVLVPKEDGGVLSRRGCVDYSTGKVAPGVFVVIATQNEHIKTDMKFLSMGEGPYYTLYRPYHLCNVETPVSIAEAVLYKESTVVSRSMVSEVATVAKRDLKAGETLGEIGSPDIFGRTYVFGQARAQKAVPLGIAPGGRVSHDIRKGELLTEDNFKPDADKYVYKLRRLQDSQIEMEQQFTA
jgi:predicted homoserine dehydrogenase-like protein